MTPINNNQMSELRENTGIIWVKCRFCGGHFEGESGKDYEVRDTGVLVGECSNCTNELSTLISHERAEAVDWATGDDTGVSSTVIMRYMLGLEPNHWGVMPPSDSDDRGRCIRLLKKFPQWLERLDEMKQFVGWDKQIPLIREEYLKEEGTK